MSLTERSGVGRRLGASSPRQVHYLLVRCEGEGFELFNRRAGAVRIFASREAAEEFLGSRGGEWRVKELSSGEVISHLFAFDEREVWAAGLMSRDDFVELLVEN